MQVSIDDVMSALHSGKAKIKFHKKDGSVREGVFTLNQELIDATGYKFPKKKEGAPVRRVNPAQLNMFEVTTNAWKSCLKDSIISCEKV